MIVDVDTSLTAALGNFLCTFCVLFSALRLGFALRLRVAFFLLPLLAIAASRLACTSGDSFGIEWFAD